MRVLGLDPGSRYTGYGIVERSGGRLLHVASGRVNATRGEDFGHRLEIIYEGLTEILSTHPCDVAAVETLFTARNALSTIKLGHARGVTLLALRHHELDVSEYAPASVKQAVAGHGRATKDDITLMVKRLLGLRGDLSADAADALAIAICHCQMLDFERRLEPGVS